MTEEKLSPAGQVAFATVLALTIDSFLFMGLTVSQIPGGPDPSASYIAIVFADVGVVLVVLTWWGRKAAFPANIGYGVFNIVTVILGGAGVFGPVATEAFAPTATVAIISLILIGSSWVAWRE